jgi:hypothetical protein
MVLLAGDFSPRPLPKQPVEPPSKAVPPPPHQPKGSGSGAKPIAQHAPLCACGQIGAPRLQEVGRGVGAVFLLPRYRFFSQILTAVELQATTEPHCSRGVQPGGIYVCVVQREPTPGGPGSGLRPGRRRFLCQLPL